ncbi:hypothetical protein, partial [Chroococcus sp. FPU101]|uniref:hypothetical protein n=1 Tax=Chroococcus sp. FPU101 TaxID=1974212 RepID=UPI001A904A30
RPTAMVIESDPLALMKSKARFLNVIVFEIGILFPLSYRLGVPHTCLVKLILSECDRFPSVQPS